MKQKQHIVAIEIGSSKVVGAVAQIDDSRIVVEHLEEEAQINCVNYGCVQNVENIKSCINHILRKIENVIEGTVTQVFVGLSGRSLHSEASEVNRSIDATQAIKQTTIESIMRETSRNNVKRYETIEAVPRAFYVDKMLVTTNDPVGQYGSSIKIKFNMIVANSNLTLNLNRVTNALNPKNITTVLAMGQHILTTEEKRLGCMLVDMGAETTTVAIYKGGMLVYVNTLPLGGRNLTLDIANGLGVLEETAERVKKNINNPLDLAQVDSIVMENINAREAANYINARTGEIIANINKQLEYAGTSASEIQTIVLTGGAAQLKGINKKLEETTKMAVRMANMPSNIFFNCNRANDRRYVQLMAIIAEAARIIDPMDTCVKLHDFNPDGGDFTTNTGQDPVIEEKPAEPKQPTGHKPNKPQKKSTSWLKNLRDRVEKALTTEGEDDD